MNDLSERAAAVTIGQQHITLFMDRAEKYALLVVREMQLNDERAPLETGLVSALLGTENEATKKPHSVSSATEAVKSHPEWLDHKRTLRDVVLEKNRACTQMTAARLNVELATAQLRSLPALEGAAS